MRGASSPTQTVILRKDYGGANSTWAESNGRVDANDPDVESGGNGGSQDERNCTGVIIDAEIPVWAVELSTRMGVSTSGYQGGSFDSELESVARGLLAIYGDFTGSPIRLCKEVRTSNTSETGSYDIEEIIDDELYEFPDGGMCRRPSNPLSTRDVFFDLSFDQVQFGVAGDTIEFTYESRTEGSLALDFDEAGDEYVEFSVSQNAWMDSDGNPVSAGEWEGVAVAWDMIPTGPVLIQTFILD